MGNYVPPNRQCERCKAEGVAERHPTRQSTCFTVTVRLCNYHVRELRKLIREYVATKA